MLSREEYKREYIRMMDSVRDKDSMYINQACCAGVNCDDCFLHDGYGCICDCEGVHAYEIIERVEKWSKEHHYSKSDKPIGKWEQIDNDTDTFFTMHQYKCSNCGKIQIAKSKNIKNYRYCSKCGAKMEQGENT